MRIHDNIDAHLSKHKFGFRKSRARNNYAIFIMRQILEKANEHQVPLYFNDVGCKAAFDTIVEDVKVYWGGSQYIVTPNGNVDYFTI